MAEVRCCGGGGTMGARGAAAGAAALPSESFRLGLMAGAAASGLVVTRPAGLPADPTRA